ncbi:Heterokaryon incompatibility protein [Fusarium longipes]|uniref:Heterokaryon incompatibility protein n=1 Tax=Fusarium longipes TaxID=694270 RepID=A0A395S428_9HYPO|nr:Heterokaryon incompatibility protein [Fusarium longipes]
MSETLLPAKTTRNSPPGHDIFCTPENSDFISKVPYTSLSTTQREIRLLKVLPDSGSGFVECELLPSIKLANVHKQYLALSYCAGSPKTTEIIMVNGARCNVFANLHHALTEARHYWQKQDEQRDFLLWVDQICINQFDLAERSHQVGFMRDIYSNAEKTLICLSTSEAHGEEMKWLIDLRDHLAQRDLGKSELEMFLILVDIWIKGEHIKNFAAFCVIAASPWWCRAWVFQEFMVSAQTIFLYGGYPALYSDIMDLIAGLWRVIKAFRSDYRFKRYCLESQHCEYLSHDQVYTFASQMDRFRLAKLNQSRTMDLKSLLLLTKDSQASDVRDKLYSLLGLARPGYGIMPDYCTKTDIHNLLIETTKKIILFDDSLAVLSFQDRSSQLTSETRGFLPSWVLDWTDGANLGYINSSTTGADEIIGTKCWWNYNLMRISPAVSFLQVPHPEDPEVQTTILQVWAVRLDYDFQRIADSSNHLVGTRNYKVDLMNPDMAESDCELWLIRGADEPVLLSKYSYGYRVLRPIIHVEIYKTLSRIPGILNDIGEIDVRKMEEIRITLF